MHTITELREACVSAAQPVTIKRYSVTTQEAEALLEDEDGDLVLYVDHMKDREEGLAREANLAYWKAQAEDGWKQATRVIDMQREKLDKDEAQTKALKQRLDDARELLAKAIYLQWYDYPGYVPWVEGGSSPKQEEARDEAWFQLPVPAPGCVDGA